MPPQLRYTLFTEVSIPLYLLSLLCTDYLGRFTSFHRYTISYSCVIRCLLRFTSFHRLWAPDSESKHQIQLKTLSHILSTNSYSDMSSIKLGDSLMKVPTLDVAGLNWVIYKDRFLWSLDACGLLDHVDGSALEPARPVLRPRCAAAASTRTPAAAAASGAGDKEGAEDSRDELPEDLSAAETLLVQDWEKKLRSGSRGRLS